MYSLTSDGPTDNMLQGGTFQTYKTVNFGSRPEEAFSAF